MNAIKVVSILFVLEYFPEVTSQTNPSLQLKSTNFPEIESSYRKVRKRREIDLKNLIHQIENDENTLSEIEDFGLQAMNDFFDVQEEKLFNSGSFLEPNHPASHVGAFNNQSDEAKELTKIAYAALKSSKKLIETYNNVSRETLINAFERNWGTSWVHQRTFFRERCPRKNMPICPPASMKYRTADGSCNNIDHPWWGSAMSTMQRFLNPVYDDGIETIRKSINGKELPSPRLISSIIHRDKNVPLASLTHMLMQWGQFIDHDMIATAQSRGFNGSFPKCCPFIGPEFENSELRHPDCLPITVSLDDNFFGKLGVRCLEFVRSGPAPRKDCGFGPREQLSQVSSFLDASMVYSSNVHHSDSLRVFRNGLLQYGKRMSSRQNFPKDKPKDLCHRGSLATNCFRAGDARISEQPALTSVHVVFLRLHNKIATELSAMNVHWNDEKVFQETRKIIGAMIQHITYHEFLPIVLGTEVMKIFDLDLKREEYYEGYDPSTNPNIANSFSTAAYRFGHSLVQSTFARYDAKHNVLFDNVTIHEEFANRAELHSAGSIDRLLHGLINQPSQRRDEFITTELTNHLFQLPNFPFGMDLAAINIQRGRDHGLPSYVHWREPCGLSSIRAWSDLGKTMTKSAAENFRRIYDFVEDIDLFSAGLSEKPVPGGLVGPTFACIIAQQFGNLRKGDRFWYENGLVQNRFTLPQLQEIRRVTLAQVLCQTLDNVDTIQPFVFLMPDVLKNKRLSCDNQRLGDFNLEHWRDEQPEAPPMFVSNNMVNAKSAPMTDTEKNMLKALKRPKPVQTSVNQKNRVVVKRPLGASHENLTISLQNQASNSPILINNIVYGTQAINVLTDSNSSNIINHPLDP